MATIGSFCDRCILIDKGQIIHDGSVDEGISQYLSMGRVNSQLGFGNVLKILKLVKKVKNILALKASKCWMIQDLVHICSSAECHLL